MISGMSKPKKTDSPQSAKNRGTVFNLRLGLAREAQLSDYIAQQDVEPDKTAVLLKAFDEFMAKRGVVAPKERRE